MALSTVGTNALAANAVTSAKITDGTIATGDIADDAITAAKVDPTSVGSEALSSLTVDNIIINGKGGTLYCSRARENTSLR